MVGIARNASEVATFLGSPQFQLAEDALREAMVALAPGADRRVARALMGRYIVRRVERGETNAAVLRRGALADLAWKTVHAPEEIADRCRRQDARYALSERSRARPPGDRRPRT